MLLLTVDTLKTYCLIHAEYPTKYRIKDVNFRIIVNHSVFVLIVFHGAGQVFQSEDSKM